MLSYKKELSSIYLACSYDIDLCKEGVKAFGGKPKGSIIYERVHTNLFAALQRLIDVDLDTDFTPLIMERGVTAPGRTPRFSIKRSAEPNESLPVPSVLCSVFRSIDLSCSATTKMLRFLLSLK